jgi:nitrous-oxide reductase
MRKWLVWKKAGISLIAALSMVSSAAMAENLQEVMQRRGLTAKDLLAAAKTYVPTAKNDEFIVFSSTGEWGGVVVYGIPSMRILKYIPVFQPESWQGYGFDDESKQILFGDGQRPDGPTISWGDTHHPAISETNGDYDGRWLFISDKANPRVAVIDLHNFETKQIVVNPHFKSEQGGSFVSPNTDYIMETAQYPAPYKGEYHPIESFNEKYRGGVTYWHFNKKAGRIDPAKSFTVEMPPYTQDISDFGKGASNGWSFTNSFCTERYTGGVKHKSPPFEAGCSTNDNDFMHVVNWKKAQELFKDGKGKKVNGMAVLTIKTMVDNNALFLIPEPKSPHGVDVTPDGKNIIVSGKLDTNVSVYSFEKIQDAIKFKKFSGKDPYNIPIIDMKAALHGQLSIGLGPLHTQMGSEDNVAYTSLYVESMVAKWNYKTLKVLDKVPVSYNAGPLMTMHGDTVKPRGKYLVTINRLAMDRFNQVGPLHPQNHQLIDIGSEKMSLIYDMPLPLGEAHMAVAIESKLLKPLLRYNPGTNSRTNKRSAFRTHIGREKISRSCNADGKCSVDVRATLIRSHISPEKIEAEVGDTISIHLTNLERAQDETHGLTVDLMNVHASVAPGKTASITFKADREGIFPYYATKMASLLHLEMEGYLLIKPKNAKKSIADINPPSDKEQAKSRRAYETKLETIAATNNIINSVVMAITDMGYTKDPRTVAMMDDAVVQLGKLPEIEKKINSAVDAGDWNSASDWAELLWQYQIKTTEIGLRIKLILEEKAKQELAKQKKLEPVKQQQPKPVEQKKTAPVKSKTTEPLKQKQVKPVKAEKEKIKLEKAKPVKLEKAKPVKLEKAKPAQKKKLEEKKSEPVQKKKLEEKKSGPVKAELEKVK